MRFAFIESFHERVRTRWLRRGATAGTVLLLAPALAACGSSSGSPSSTAANKTCKQVAAVLSDGPDPGADPVGYAQAQILQLRQIHTADGKLGQKIGALASTYQAYSSTNGANAADKDAANAAIRAINAACPGAGAAL